MAKNRPPSDGSSNGSPPPSERLSRRERQPDWDETEDPEEDGPGPGSRTETPAEALARARMHARAALGEALAALHAALDAAALASSGETAEMHRFLGPVAKLLEGLAADLESGDGGRGAQVLDAVADALDAEIARWEARARSEPEARAVLRAFLGVREVLWELGVRRASEEPAGPNRPHKARPGRVQRVPVEG